MPTPLRCVGIAQLSVRRHHVVSSILQRIVRRRIGSAVSGLLGLFFLISAAGSHMDNWRDAHIEYTQNILVFIIISLACVGIAGALPFAAWRLWRIP
jgi:hypothetical protein